MRREIVLDLARWARPPDAVDRALLARCVAPTLDVGCGPGRMVLALGRRGVPALGIDVTSDAVRRVRAGGGLALHRSVFGPVPGEGRWPTALLLDGCVGIGGAPDRLLARVAELLSPDGVAYVEHHPDPRRSERVTGRVRALTGRCGAPFAWAVVGLDALVGAAAAAGLAVVDSWVAGGRAFAAVRRERR